MPSDRDPDQHDLEQQLRAFGATLAHGTGEPIAPEGASVTPITAGGSRRRWALIGAAACVVALVGGLIAFGRSDPPEQGAAVVPTSDDVAASQPLTDAFTVPDDPLALAELGFPIVDQRAYSPYAVVDTTSCQEYKDITALGGGYVIMSTFRDDSDVPAFVQVQFARYADGATARAALAPLTDFTDRTDCGGYPVPESAAPFAIAVPSTTVTVAAYRSGEFSVVITAAAPDGRGMVITIGGGDVGALAEDVAERAARYLEAGEPWPVVPPATTVPHDTVVPGTTIAPPDGTDMLELMSRLGGDPLGLGTDGWVRIAHDAQPFEVSDTIAGCTGIEALAALGGVSSWRDVYRNDAQPDVTLVVTFLPATAGQQVIDGVTAIANCTPSGNDDSSGGGAFSDSGGGTAGFTNDGAFGVVAVAPPSPVVPLTVLAEANGSRVTTAILEDLTRRATTFLTGIEVPSTTAPVPVVTTAPPGTFPGGITVETPPADGPFPEIGATEEVLVLMVSNQSFEDDPVRLTISIDGQQVADDAFEVGSQHSVTNYYVRGLAPGQHEIEVESDTGVSYGSTFTMPTGAPHWAFLTYWYYPDDGNGRFVDLQESEEPIGIA